LEITVMRCRIHVFAALACLLASLSFASFAFAQAPPVYAGSTMTVSAANQSRGGGDPGDVGDWRISGPNGLYIDSSSPGGWNVSEDLYHLTISAPLTAPLGNYTAFYVTSTHFYNRPEPGYYTDIGPGATFTVVAAPPTKPAPGNPAFGWQGSVGGVNTGNGNKTTTLPIVGWTQRGGLPVSFALIHNSQGSLNGYCGYKWQMSYFTYLSPNPDGSLTLHWDSGLTYSFTNSGGTYAPPYGILDTLVRNGDGSYTLTTPGQTKYTFGFVPGNAYLSAITDLDGNTLTINHNPDTTISSLVDATGRTLSFGYDGMGHLSTVTDPLGRQWVMSYGAGSYLDSVQLPPVNGQICSLYLGYGDGRQNLTSFQSARGYTSWFAYDGSNRLISAQDPLGNTTTFTYNPTTTVITDPNGHTLTHTYQASRLASVTDALGKTESDSYDYNNILTSKTDKRGKVWGYSSHFSNGSPVSTSADPLGNATSATYDANNKVLSSTDALGNTTQNTYSTDGHDDLLSTKVTGTGASPFQATSSVSGYANGLPTTFTDALSYQSSVMYDGNGDMYRATDPNGVTTQATYNALGWKLTSTDGLGYVTRYTYDNWGRVTSVTAPDNTQVTTTYDLDGNVLTVTDADNHTVTNVYDAGDRLLTTTNGRGDVVTYTYDGPNGFGSTDRNGQTQKDLLSSKTDGNGHTTFYSYTARNEPSATYYPDGTQESITYDENGNTLTRTKPDGKVISYAYDPDNRLTDITYPTLHPTHFGYDADGRRTLMTDATGTTNWTYGDGLHLGVLVSPVGGVSYWYDADGRRTAMEGFVNGLGDVSYWYYTYDNGGRLLTLRSTTDGTTTFTYDGASRLIRKTKGNADFETYSYDAASQLTDIGYWWADGTSHNFHSYTYTAAGSLLTDDQGWYKTTYGYDGANQLTSETGSNGYPPLSYTYDHNGNRLTQTNNGSVVQSFTYDAHDKLTSGTAGAETDGYDLNGNETRLTLGGSVYQFVYDEEDRLVQGLYPGGVVDTFVYNGLGLRVGKQDSTGSYSYLCDGASPASPVLWDGQAVYTAGLSERRGGVSSYFDFDRLGNLWTVDGSAGAVQLYYQDTTGFGGVIAAAGNVGTPFRFGGGNGCQTDADIGLVLMGHRYYDTRIGRFITQDPIQAGRNWYSYVNNNPVNAADPLGLLAQPFQDPDGTSLQQMMQDTVANGGLPGETYDVTQGGKVVNTFTIPEQIGFNHIIPGYNVTAVFNAARLFAQTPLRGGRGGGHLPNYYDKEGYIYQHFYTNTGGDPKRVLVGLGNNPLYRFYDDVGNYGFGAMLAGLGFDVKDAKAKAGAFQGLQAFRLNGLRGLMDNISNNGLYPFGGRNGDDARGAQMIQQGFNDYSNR